MKRAEGHGELVGDFHREAALLGEGQVMGLGGRPPADEARLRGDELEMRFIAQAAFGADGKQALINPWTASNF